MRTRGLGMLAALTLWLAGAAAAAGLGSWDQDPTLEEQWPAGGLRIPIQEREKTFAADENRANFTFFDGVEDVAVRDGALVFTMTEDQATLGWGNYLDRQTVNEVVDLWPHRDNLVIRLKQSAPTATWHAKYWLDGGTMMQYRTGSVEVEAEVTGTDWQEVAFPEAACKAAPDGMELVLSAPAGTEVAVEWVKFVLPIYEGYMRKDFTIPEGRRIWKAVADSSSADRGPTKCLLYINGRQVRHPVPPDGTPTAAVDIAPYLRPGENCAAFYGRSPDSPFYAYLNATIILDNGETISVATDESWTYSHEQAAGWSEPGFDASGWQPVTGLNRSRGGFRAELQRPCAYRGLLDIRNPAKDDLFYRTTAPVRMNVRVPAGLDERGPVIEYRLARANSDGTDEQVDGGSSAFYRGDGASLVYRLDLGRREAGVYTIRLRLRDRDGAVIEERAREPLVVVRELDLAEVQADSYREGLDLELEKRIDFTDPNDPTPWIESLYIHRGAPMREITEPNIVRKDGLVYREVTGEKRPSMFSYRLGEFDHLGDFYVMELDYPDNASRAMQVSVSTRHEGVWSNSQSGVGADVGGKFPNTGAMQTLRWIHVADAGVHSVDVLNYQDGRPAAAKELRVYHVNGDLVSAGAGTGRRYGIHTERCFPTSGIGRNFGSENPGTSAGPGATFMERYISGLAWKLQTAERYTQYLKFAGQNLHLFGCIQYNEYNTPFMHAEAIGQPRVRNCMRTVLANVLDANAIKFITGVQYSQSRYAFTEHNSAQVARGADTPCMIDRDGNQLYLDLFTIVPNWQHPQYLRYYRNILDNVIDTFGGLEHFWGVSNFVNPCQRNNYYLPAYGWSDDWHDPLLHSYDDVTFRHFEEDTGTDLGIAADDPKRFEKRAALVQTPALREQFLAWRCERLAGFFQRAADQLHAKRPDLQFVELLGVDTPGFWEHLIREDRTAHEVWREFAIDVQELGSISNGWVTRWTASYNAGAGAPQNPWCWVPAERDIALEAFEGLPRRTVFVRSSWKEDVYLSPGHMFDGDNYHPNVLEGTDWIMDVVRTRTTPQPGGVNAREMHLLGIASGDPQLLLFGFTDLNINVGHEQAVRTLARVFTHLPDERFAPDLQTGLETNLVVRSLRREDESFFYVANPGFWPVRGTVQVQAGGPVTNLVTGDPVADAGAVQVPVDLAPYSLAAFRVGGGELEVLDYATDPVPAEELAHLTGIMDRVSGLLERPLIRRILAPEDQTYMEKTLAAARAAFADGAYARAWHRAKEPLFWSMWQDYLEKAAATYAAVPDTLQTTGRTGEYDALQHLTAHRVEAAPTIDGRLDEDAWQQVPLRVGFWRIGGHEPSLAETGVKALYGEHALYLGFVCADPDPDEIQAIAEIEDDVFHAGDDALGIFLQPNPDEPLYYQMAFTASGTTFDQRVQGGERDYEYHPEWTVATHRTDEYWSAEVMLPYEAFARAGPDKTWRANFFRVMRNDLLPLSSWAYVPRDMHAPDRFGYLEFE